MPVIERNKPYEVVIEGDRFRFPTLREMAAFARSLERRGIEVRRCQMRTGASAVTFERSAWDAR
jgi:hypothetical protein